MSPRANSEPRENAPEIREIGAETVPVGKSFKKTKKTVDFGRKSVFYLISGLDRGEVAVDVGVDFLTDECSSEV